MNLSLVSVSVSVWRYRWNTKIAYPSEMTDLPKFAELPHTAEILVALVKIALNTKFNLIYFDFSEMHVDLNGYFNPVM